MRSCALGALLLWTSAHTVHAGGVAVTDDRGAQIVLPSPAQRIVTLAPFLAELAFAAGAGARLVGVADYSDYPADARRIAHIGDASHIDFETLLSLKPDLVIAWRSGNRAADIARAEELGFKVFVAEPVTLASVSSVLRTLGVLAGSSPQATAAADNFDRALAVLRARYAARPVVRVFYEIWHEPLITVNGRHIISDVIGLCGGENVFAQAATLTPVVSLEAVMAVAPRVVLGGGSAATADDFAVEWRDLRRFAALRDIHAYFVDPDHIQRQTPRILQGAAAICEHLAAVRSAR